MMRLIIFGVLIVGSTLFLMGAWFDSLAPAKQEASIAFLPQHVPIDEEIVGSGIDADQLLHKAIEKLSRDGSGWLKTRIRQSARGAKGVFHAEGTLQRGPDRCVRLDLKIAQGKNCGTLLIVSDGERIAQVRTTPDAPPAVQLESLSQPDDNGAANEKPLIDNGCGGPLTQLRQFRANLAQATLQTGMLAEHAVIQITGTAQKGAEVTQANVYLDAQTLWPHRFEWRGPGRQLLHIDFLDGEVGQPLGVEECTRVFSYQPVGNEAINPGLNR